MSPVEETEDLEIEPDVQDEPQTDQADDDDLEIEPSESQALTPSLMVELMPAGAPMVPAQFVPNTAQFVPNTALRIAADEAATYAESLKVEGAEGLQRADLALAALRGALKAIENHLEDPIKTLYAPYKKLTNLRAEWLQRGDAVVETLNRTMFAEQQRLERVAREDARKAQAEADEKARAEAQREAEAAAKAQAPAPVVEELKRQALTATAPPVQNLYAPLPLSQSTPVKKWKCRLTGTPGSDEPNPAMADLSPAQRHQVLQLLKAIVDGKAPLVGIAIDWTYWNKRAVSDKGTLQIPGLEAFEDGGLRAKSNRR